MKFNPNQLEFECTGEADDKEIFRDELEEY